MKAYRHFPKRGDVVYSSEREELGLSFEGTITFVDRDGEEVHVQWGGRKIISVINCFDWYGHTVKSHHFVVDGIWYPSIISITQPYLLLPGGDTDTISFDDLEGNWSSNEGGKGAYMI